MGRHLVFKDAEEVVNSLTGAGVDAKQIERIRHHYGHCLERERLSEIRVEGYEEVAPDESEKLHYVSVDGSMCLTREEGWKEIGRMYKGEDLVKVSDGRCELQGSTYVAHLGRAGEFLPKMEYHIENLRNKVFIADGATWIWNWAEDTYPDCVQIVDFFHAKEHLYGFARDHFNDGAQRDRWADIQGRAMLGQGVAPVIRALRALPRKTEGLGKPIGYYTNHEKRMQYHVFREKGLIIGSGAMESAHKDVLQERLKLSGQRWTKDVAQLRAAHKSGNWDRVIRLCHQKAA